eukprot:g2900.t1
MSSSNRKRKSAFNNDKKTKAFRERGPIITSSVDENVNTTNTAGVSVDDKSPPNLNRPSRGMSSACAPEIQLAKKLTGSTEVVKNVATALNDIEYELIISNALSIGLGKGLNTSTYDNYFRYIKYPLNKGWLRDNLTSPSLFKDAMIKSLKNRINYGFRDKDNKPVYQKLKGNSMATKVPLSPAVFQNMKVAWNLMFRAIYKYFSYSTSVTFGPISQPLNHARVRWCSEFVETEAAVISEYDRLYKSVTKEYAPFLWEKLLIRRGGGARGGELERWELLILAREAWASLYTPSSDNFRVNRMRALTVALFQSQSADRGVAARMFMALVDAFVSDENASKWMYLDVLGFTLAGNKVTPEKLGGRCLAELRILPHFCPSLNFGFCLASLYQLSKLEASDKTPYSFFKEYLVFGGHDGKSIKDQTWKKNHKALLTSAQTQNSSAPVIGAKTKNCYLHRRSAAKTMEQNDINIQNIQRGLTHITKDGGDFHGANVNSYVPLGPTMEAVRSLAWYGPKAEDVLCPYFDKKRANALSRKLFGKDLVDTAMAQFILPLVNVTSIKLKVERLQQLSLSAKAEKHKDKEKNNQQQEIIEAQHLNHFVKLINYLKHSVLLAGPMLFLGVSNRRFRNRDDLVKYNEILLLNQLKNHGIFNEFGLTSNKQWVLWCKCWTKCVLKREAVEEDKAKYYDSSDDEFEGIDFTEAQQMSYTLSVETEKRSLENQCRELGTRSAVKQAVKVNPYILADSASTEEVESVVFSKKICVWEIVEALSVAKKRHLQYKKGHKHRQALQKYKRVIKWAKKIQIRVKNEEPVYALAVLQQYLNKEKMAVSGLYKLTEEVMQDECKTMEIRIRSKKEKKQLMEQFNDNSVKEVM